MLVYARPLSGRIDKKLLKVIVLWELDQSEKRREEFTFHSIPFCSFGIPSSQCLIMKNFKHIESFKKYTVSTNKGTTFLAAIMNIHYNCFITKLKENKNHETFWQFSKKPGFRERNVLE